MDTIKIIQDSVLINQVLIPDTLNIKAVHHSINETKNILSKDIIGMIAGIVAVCLGYLLNQITAHFKEKKTNTGDFSSQLVLFSKGESNYMDLLIYYNRLTIKQKSNINIVSLKNSNDPIHRRKECERLLENLKS